MHQQLITFIDITETEQLKLDQQHPLVDGQCVPTPDYVIFDQLQPHYEYGEDIDVCYQISPHYRPKSTDWIGLFRPTSHDVDAFLYVNFRWAPKRAKYCDIPLGRSVCFTEECFQPYTDINDRHSDEHSFVFLYITTSEKMIARSQTFIVRTPINLTDECKLLSTSWSADTNTFTRGDNITDTAYTVAEDVQGNEIWLHEQQDSNEAVRATMTTGCLDDDPGGAPTRQRQNAIIKSLRRQVRAINQIVIANETRATQRLLSVMTRYDNCIAGLISVVSELRTALNDSQQKQRATCRMLAERRRITQRAMTSLEEQDAELLQKVISLAKGGQRHCLQEDRIVNNFDHSKKELQNETLIHHSVNASSSTAFGSRASSALKSSVTGPIVCQPTCPPALPRTCPTTCPTARPMTYSTNCATTCSTNACFTACPSGSSRPLRDSLAEAAHVFAACHSGILDHRKCSKKNRVTNSSCSNDNHVFIEQPTIDPNSRAIIVDGGPPKHLSTLEHSTKRKAPQSVQRFSEQDKQLQPVKCIDTASGRTPRTTPRKPSCVKPQSKSKKTRDEEQDLVNSDSTGDNMHPVISMRNLITVNCECSHCTSTRNTSEEIKLIKSKDVFINDSNVTRTKERQRKAHKRTPPGLPALKSNANDVNYHEALQESCSTSTPDNQKNGVDRRARFRSRVATSADKRNWKFFERPSVVKNNTVLSPRGVDVCPRTLAATLQHADTQLTQRPSADKLAIIQEAKRNHASQKSDALKSARMPETFTGIDSNDMGASQCGWKMYDNQDSYNEEFGSYDTTGSDVVKQIPVQQDVSSIPLPCLHHMTADYHKDRPKASDNFSIDTGLPRHQVWMKNVLGEVRRLRDLLVRCASLPDSADQTSKEKGTKHIEVTAAHDGSTSSSTFKAESTPTAVGRSIARLSIADSQLENKTTYAAVAKQFRDNVILYKLVTAELLACNTSQSNSPSPKPCTGLVEMCSVTRESKSGRAEFAKGMTDTAKHSTEKARRKCDDETSEDMRATADCLSKVTEDKTAQNMDTVMHGNPVQLEPGNKCIECPEDSKTAMAMFPRQMQMFEEPYVVEDPACTYCSHENADVFTTNASTGPESAELPSDIVRPVRSEDHIIQQRQNSDTITYVSVDVRGQTDPIETASILSALIADVESHAVGKRVEDDQMNTALTLNFRHSYVLPGEDETTQNASQYIYNRELDVNTGYFETVAKRRRKSTKRKDA